MRPAPVFRVARITHCVVPRSHLCQGVESGDLALAESLTLMVRAKVPSAIKRAPPCTSSGAADGEHDVGECVVLARISEGSAVELSHRLRTNTIRLVFRLASEKEAFRQARPDYPDLKAWIAFLEGV